MNESPRINRRELLQRLAALAATPATRASLGLLGGITAASAVAAPASDYRALVCVHLGGGNDGFNWLIPSDSTRYSVYASRRKVVQIPQAQLLPLNVGADGGQYGLHPACPNLQTMYNAGKAAFVANLGTLLQPTTVASFNAGSNLPPRLFSHIDQVSAMFAQTPSQTQPIGWAGRLADLMATANSNPAVSMNLSLAGVNGLQTGTATVPFCVAPGGVASVVAATAYAGRARQYNALFAQSLQGSADLLTAGYAGVMRATIAQGAQIAAAAATAPTFTTVFGSDPLSQQLLQIAKLIAVRDTLGASRQTFYAYLNGFDTHDFQLTTQALLLGQLDTALASFYGALAELGAADRVLSFTMSDFGRTYDPNDDGTDHGWGNNALIVGGGLAGGRVYGQFPDCSSGSSVDTPGGRFIPTSAIDQYGATLCKWFGADATAVSTIFPNLGNFASRDLGFAG